MPIRRSVRGAGVAVALIAIPTLVLTDRAERGQKEATVMSTRQRNVEVMLTVFRELEERGLNRRNVERELAFYQPDVEFHWPSALPYGGTVRGVTQSSGNNWSATWTPLQPTEVERKMDPRVIGADDNQVVILYHQRGVSPSGERFDGEVIGLYELRDFKLSRAQMFYFDEAALSRFLDRAAAELKHVKR